MLFLGYQSRYLKTQSLKRPYVELLLLVFYPVTTFEPRHDRVPHHLWQGADGMHGRGMLGLTWPPTAPPPFYSSSYYFFSSSTFSYSSFSSSSSFSDNGNVTTTFSMSQSWSVDPFLTWHVTRIHTYTYKKNTTMTTHALNPIHLVAAPVLYCFLTLRQ